MNRDLYSNDEFTNMKKAINEEMLRRGTYRWWNPLTTPAIGEDKSSPIILDENADKIEVNDKTYTINNPSEGSIEPTRNIQYPAHGENPSGEDPNYEVNSPSTSAAAINVDEFKNYLVGLSKIKDINLFYGRDECNYLAYRDPQGIQDVIEDAQSDVLNKPLAESDNPYIKNDPNGKVADRVNPLYPVSDTLVQYPNEDGQYVMPSGEYDGEELKQYENIGPTNFYDDYGAQAGDSNFHPYNRYVSLHTRRDWNDQNDYRQTISTSKLEGGKSSIRFGTNPRNPQMGDQYGSRPVFGGKVGSCNIACTGMCYMTCDNQCSESCSTTCWARCGNSCTMSCGNSCTGCSSQCMNTCKTKCEDATGYSCVKSGAMTVKIETTGGEIGIPAENHISSTYHTCDGCSFSCQFYPNKKTECWDAGCMGKCFVTCLNSCSDSCFGGCINNNPSDTNDTTYKVGKGRGCSSGCTLNCIGTCKDSCVGYCITGCFMSCIASCEDNCTFRCSTICGNGCNQGCTQGCTGCHYECTGACTGLSDSRTCVGCGSVGGCTTNCMMDCNGNCMASGCRSICGTESSGACSSNCRLNCTESSCTSMCSEACSTQCNTCVNTCGHQCGMCSSLCSTGCESECNITCTGACENSCTSNCVTSCSSECGGCSNLCYSCTGMCIGVCSVKCEVTCSNCAGLCSWWCDTQCNQTCFSDCISRCINSCSGSCATYLTSEAKTTKGPERKPTAQGWRYPNPSNRWEERESFKLFHDVDPYKRPEIIKEILPITITMVKVNKYVILEMSLDNVSENLEIITDITDTDIITTRGSIKKSDIINAYKYHYGSYRVERLSRINKYEYVYRWDINKFGTFTGNKDIPYWNDENNLVVITNDLIKYQIYSTPYVAGVYDVNKTTGEITVNDDALNELINGTLINKDGNHGLYVVKIFQNEEKSITSDMISIDLPFGLDTIGSTVDKDGNFIIIIRETVFLLESEKEELEANNGQDKGSTV